jgi:hypothetical protein
VAARASDHQHLRHFVASVAEIQILQRSILPGRY